VTGSSTIASCPSCEAPVAGGTARCERCGFVFYEGGPRRPLPRPLLRLVGLGAVIVGAGAALAVVLTRDAPPEPLAPVAAQRAEQRLAVEFRRAGGPAGRVACPGPIRLGAPTRCQFVYPDLDTQVMLVGLRRNGELTTEVPYPARREPR
jgi:hypothetical protein